MIANRGRIVKLAVISIAEIEWLSSVMEIVARSVRPATLGMGDPAYVAGDDVETDGRLIVSPGMRRWPTFFGVQN